MSRALLRRCSPALIAALLVSCDFAPEPWTADEIDILESLWLESLPALPPDPSNAVADNPLAAEFGKKLFFDTRFSANGAVSCATCHDPGRRFTDGKTKGVGVGMSRRNTPSIVGSAYSPWLYRDGRLDSQWAQALEPFEDPERHGSNRLTVVALVMDNREYRRFYRALFGEVSNTDTMFSNIGKAIAAFERTVMPTAARFDEYVAAVVADDMQRQRALFSDDEVRGLRLFIGKARCAQCHNGPLLTGNGFHNTGLRNSPGEEPDAGRAAGKFRTPSLRNLGGTDPYGHAGQLPTLAAVLTNYNEARDAMIGQNEARPLGLGRRELVQLEAFLGTLDAPTSFRAGDL